MATVRICDGCGAPAPIWTIGTVIPREYCDNCAEHAREYVSRRNKAHKRAVEKWLEKHNAILEEHFPLEHLPDA